MIDHVVLAMRASPNWAEYARDYSAGIPIEPVRYLPPSTSHFPRDLVALIERWNRFSNISYFACRQRIREIASDNLSAVKDATLVRSSAIPSMVDRMANDQLLVFFHDDDDWFHPGLAGVIQSLDLNAASFDSIIFPFLRLASNVVTFTRDGLAVASAIGSFESFRFRYCTNNYGLTHRALATGVSSLVEHVDASARAASLDFADIHCDIVISATSKTPCSASWLPQLPDEFEAFRNYVRNYVGVLRSISLSSSNHWIATPLRQTIDLFSAVTQET